MSNYNTKYKKEYCDKLIEHMSLGFSYESFGAEIKCGRSTLYEWEAKHKEWKRAKKLAIEAAQKFFEQRLIAKISGKKFSNINVKDIDTSCLIFALKTRFHETYGEKQKLEHTSPDESMKPQVNFYIPKNGREADE